MSGLLKGLWNIDLWFENTIKKLVESNCGKISQKYLKRKLCQYIILLKSHINKVVLQKLVSGLYMCMF